MVLEAVDFVNGIFSIIFVAISFTVGLKIALKFLENKDQPLLFFGLSWMGMSSPWLPSSISFISNILFNVTPPIAFLLIFGNIFLPIVLIIWMSAFSELFYETYKKRIILIFILVAILFYSIFFSLLMINPELIGTIPGPIDIHYGIFIIGYHLFALAIIAITGTLFSLRSLRSLEPEFKLKGKFLIIAFAAFVFGAILDIFSGINLVILVVGRIFLIMAAIYFYYGFFLPKWMKELFLRDSQKKNNKK